MTTLLVSLGWKGGGISEGLWTVAAIAAGLVVGIMSTLKNMDIAYAFVILWAYTGILIKHLSSGGFGGKYPEVVIAAAVSMAVIMILIIFVVVKNNGKKSV
jgi:ABC-type sugar transport system permease subunit